MAALTLGPVLIGAFFWTVALHIAGILVTH
jgi:hypothetical protein